MRFVPWGLHSPRRSQSAGGPASLTADSLRVIYSFGRGRHSSEARCRLQRHLVWLPRLNATATTVNGGQDRPTRHAIPCPWGQAWGRGYVENPQSRASFSSGAISSGLSETLPESTSASASPRGWSMPRRKSSSVSAARARAFSSDSSLTAPTVTRRVRPSAKSRCTTYVLAFDNRPKCNVSKEGACPTLSEMSGKKKQPGEPSGRT